MDLILKLIKRLIIQGFYQFTFKAECELESDGLFIEDALESILNASNINKVINSHNSKTGKKESYTLSKAIPMMIF